jgi:hypothetical protein
VGTLSEATPDATHEVTIGAGLAELRVTMNGDSLADFDLYVRSGAPPTPAIYDCKDDGTNQFAGCMIANPAAGTWYVLVHRNSGTGVYQVTTTSLAVGSPGPGGSGGMCDDGNGCTTGDTCNAALCVGTPAADGTPCNDASVCTGGDECEAGACAGIAAPLPACSLPAARGAQIALKNVVDDRKDGIKLKWSKGDAPSVSLGDPTTSTGYHVCVFDETAGTPAVAFEATVPPGAGWSATGSGFKYRDKTGSAGGITAIGLKASSQGKGALKVDGKGLRLGMPALPLAQDPKVRLQVSNDTACWQADFSTNSKNDGLQFKAKSD